MDSNIKIAVIGLGYVGLPLGLFATKYAVVGMTLTTLELLRCSLVQIVRLK
jgi:UDP-N-acetyl-D-galactosamine dehydrogenase